SSLGQTSKSELSGILIAANDLHDFADCHRPGVDRSARQQQDAEHRSNGAEGSTPHRVEVPPGISSSEQRNVGKDLHHLNIGEALV
ncbi:MAG: hypothetical protein ACRD2L_06950, partial [Terriglobia bacterium]